MDQRAHREYDQLQQEVVQDLRGSVHHWARILDLLGLRLADLRRYHPDRDHATGGPFPLDHRSPATRGPTGASDGPTRS